MGPGFFGVSLVPEEQEPATPTKPTAQAMATAGMNLDAIASLQVDELQNLIESLQGLAVSSQEGPTPTRQPPVHTATKAAEEEIRWEQMVEGRLLVSEEPHTRPPPTHNPVSTKTLARENLQSDSCPPPQVVTSAEV